MITMREPTKSEQMFLQEELDYWVGKEARINIMNAYSFVVGEGNWSELFMVNKQTFNYYQTHPNLSPYSIGLGIGEYKGSNFFFTLGGMTQLLKESKKRVIVNETAEQLFLYSRDIIGKSINKIVTEIKKEEKIIIVNIQGDVLGMGKAIIDGEEMKTKQFEEEPVIKNLIDLGWYLRKGK